MSPRGGQVGESQRSTRRDQDSATAVQRVLDNHTEELLWIAEVMTGSRPAAEECLAEAIELAEAAQYIGEEWMLSWVKRLLVHVALKRISGEIRELLPAARTRSDVALAGSAASSRDRQKLRSISPQRIVASLDVLERACFILHVYLAYPLLDCALLLGCPRCWIESICERVLTNVVAVGHLNSDNHRYVDSIDFNRGDGMCGLKVLSVGLNELAYLVRDALMFRPHSKLAVVTNYLDLCSMSLQREEFQVAVLNDANPARELRRRAKYIRRSWPNAAILLVGGSSELLEQPLYDERVPTRIGPADLLTVIDRLNPRVGESRQQTTRARCQR